MLNLFKKKKPVMLEFITTSEFRRLLLTIGINASFVSEKDLQIIINKLLIKPTAGRV